MSPNSFAFLRYLNTVFDNIKDAVMLISIEPEDGYRLILTNQAFHSMSGFGKDCIGKDLSELVDTERHQFLKKRYRRVIKLKKPTSYRSWYIVPKGERAFEIDVIPVLNTVDEVVQLIVLARDVTKITKLEEKIRRLKAAPSQLPRTKK